MLYVPEQFLLVSSYLMWKFELLVVGVTFINFGLRVRIKVKKQSIPGA
jgi:hypothetical protein